MAQQNFATAASLPRETAEITREFADDRTFTEEEMRAITADNVSRETASLNQEVTDLKVEKAELEAKVTDLENSLDLAEQAKEKAEQDLADYKESITREKELAELADQRTEKVREIAKGVKEDFFTPERKERWAKMGAEEFDSYVGELAELYEANAETEDPAESKRESASAMRGDEIAGTKMDGSVALKTVLGKVG